MPLRRDGMAGGLDRGADAAGGNVDVERGAKVVLPVGGR